MSDKCKEDCMKCSCSCNDTKDKHHHCNDCKKCKTKDNHHKEK